MAKRQAINFGSSGKADTFVATELPSPGQLGGVYEQGTKAWQVVQLDSTADAAAVAGDVVYWKDRDRYTVTTTIAESHRNEVAGVAPVGVPVGSYFALRVSGKQSTKGAGTFALGTLVVSDVASNQVIPLAADSSTAATDTQTKFTVLGTAQGAVASGKVDVFLTLGPI